MALNFEFHLSIQGAGPSQDFTVPVGITIIGRQPGSELMLEHPQISRRHAQLIATLTECEITDLGSANGSYVNGNKLDPNLPLVLRPGDTIQMGPFTLAFQQFPIDEPAEVGSEELSARELSADDLPSEDLPPEVTFPEPESKQPQDAPAEPVVGAVPVADEGSALDALSEAALSEAAPIEAQTLEPGARIFEMVPGGLSVESLLLLRFLPGAYQTDFMSRFLGLFESILLPIGWNIDNFDFFLDPDLAPNEFLPWLANWFGLLLQPYWTPSQRREFLKQAGAIYSRRGTRWAMEAILKIFTGYDVRVEDTAKTIPAYTFEVHLPAQREKIDLGHLNALIDANKPAYTSYVLVFNE